MIQLIPAIDIIEGKCVRLTKGDYNKQKTYSSNPVDVAKSFEDAGVNRLHLVDLDGAKAKHIVNHKTLEQIASQTSLTIDFGGGLKTDEDLHIAFNSGASMITGGSIAIKQPDVFSSWLQKYGNEKIILGADVKDEMVSVNGWQENTSTSLSDLLEQYIPQGINKVICTDISKDGMLQGPSVELYKKILKRYPDLFLTASGGVSSTEDIQALQEAGVPAVIFGKAIYENKISLSDFKLFI